MFWGYYIALLLVVIFIAVYFFHPLCKPAILDLRGAHVLIPGGSSGIGKAIACLAVARGAKVTLVARDKKKLEKAKAEIHSKNPGTSGKEVVSIVSLDLRDGYSLVEKTILEAERVMGPIDVCINCVGSAILTRIDQTPYEHFETMLDINYLTSVKVMKAVLPGMQKRKKGRIAFISSMAGAMGLHGTGCYSPAKFALRGLAESLQMEMRPYNIFVTLSYPPGTSTPGRADEKNRRTPEMVTFSAIGVVAEPEHVGSVILNDVLKGRFLSFTGIENYSIMYATQGFAPSSSLVEDLLQVFMCGLFRLIALGLRFFADMIVYRCHSRRPQPCLDKRRG